MTQRRSGQRKDRLIQTRVPKDLESTLKDEARKQRLSVSHLIRNVLEDTFNLVDNVVVEVDKVVTDSVTAAQTFKRDAVRLAQTVQGSTAHRDGEEAEDGEGPVRVDVRDGSEPEPDAVEAPAEPAELDLSSVYAWQPVVINKPTSCSRCEKELTKGEQGHMGLTGEPGPPRFWLCESCVESL